MNENVKKVFDLFEGRRVLSILESEQNYIACVCDKDARPDVAAEELYAVNKNTFKVSEFSYFSNPDEYAEACNNVIYKYDETTTDDELTHWGIKGMKWGIRRYQNKDGSLTSAGRKRYQSELAKVKAEEQTLKRRKATQAKIENLQARKRAVEEEKRSLDSHKKKSKNVEQTSAKRTAKDMSDDELRDLTNRMMMEANYHNAKKHLEAATPKQVSAGKKFLDGLVNDVITPAAKNVGRVWLENVLKDKLGLNKADPLVKLERQVKKLELNKKISDLQKGDTSDEDFVRAMEFFRSIPPEARTELKDAATMFENMDKVRKKGRT